MDSLIEEPLFYNTTDPLAKQGYQKLLEVLQDEAYAGKIEVNELPENHRWLGLLAQKTGAKIVVLASSVGSGM